MHLITFQGKIGMVLFNNDDDIDVWKKVSSRSEKYDEKECEKKWTTFSKGPLTIFKFLQDHAPALYEEVKELNYEFLKKDFEQTHFKVMNPFMIVRITDTGLQQLSKHDFTCMYENKRFYNTGSGKYESFTEFWLKDKTIRTYENLCFLPKLQAPPNQYNMFKDFPVEAVKGDISVVQGLLKVITNNDENVFDYVEKWFASILQKPSQKTGVVLVVSGKQGVGKDMIFNFIGSLFGPEYFFNTGDAENDVYCRFNDHQQKIIFMKFEEANFVTNKTHADKLKNLITSNTRKYEGKGLKPVTLNNYINLVMTTNHSVPILLEDTDRRFCCIQASEEKRGDFEYWSMVNDVLEKQTTKNAYYYYLMKMDLADFNPRDYPRTDYLDHIKQALAPQHARFFQRMVEQALEYEQVELKWPARTLFNKIKDEYKYEYTESKFGTDMNEYYLKHDALTKKKSGGINHYAMRPEKMQEYLKSKNWWVEL